METVEAAVLMVPWRAEVGMEKAEPGKTCLHSAASSFGSPDLATLGSCPFEVKPVIQAYASA